MKKGLTLIELLVTMVIAAMLLSFEAAVFAKHLYSFEQKITYNKQNYFCEEFFVIFEQLISENMQQIEVSDNDVVVKCSCNQKKKIHYNMTSRKILVDYYDGYGNDFSAANVICTNVRGMSVNKKGCVLYVSVVTDKGVKFERCFGIKEVHQ